MGAWDSSLGEDIMKKGYSKFTAAGYPIGYRCTYGNDNDSPELTLLFLATNKDDCEEDYEETFEFYHKFRNENKNILDELKKICRDNNNKLKHMVKISGWLNPELPFGVHGTTKKLNGLITKVEFA